MKTKKIISLLLAVVMIAGVLPMSAAAFSIDDAKAVIVDATENFVKTAKDAANADLVRVAADQMNAKNVETVKEILDNGTDVFVEGSEIAATAEALGCEVSDYGFDDVLLGGYVTTNGEDYKLTVIGAALTGNDIDPVKKNRFSQIKAEDVLNYNELVASFDTSEDSTKAVDDDTASLQAVQFSYGGYIQGSEYRRFWFAENEALGNYNYKLTPYDYYGECDADGNYKYWVYEGSLVIAPTFYLMNSNDFYKYVYVDCNVRVSPKSDEDKNSVEEYTFAIRTVSPGDEIVSYEDVTIRNTDDKCYINYESVELSAGYKDFDASVSIPVKVTEYEVYDETKAVSVTESKNATGTQVSWTVIPAGTHSKIKGQEFCINPGALVRKNTQNRDGDFHVFLFFEEVELWGGARPYSLRDNSMAESSRGCEYTVKFSDFHN